MDSEQLIVDFVTLLSEAHWNMDYSRFCEILEVSQNQYSEEKYKRWQEILLAINSFDIETLAKLIS